MSDAQERVTIAVIDDDEAARHSIGQMLRLRGWSVEVFSSAEAALAWPGLRHAMCIVTDVKMPGMDGEEFLAHVTALEGAPPVVMITGHGDIAMAVRCLKAGAFDFAEKPFDDDVLIAYVGKAVEQARLRREATDLRRRLTLFSPGEDGRFGMVGRSRAMQDVYAQVEAAARADAPVLVFGETGVGKELVARAIHAQSPRSRGPFVPVNAGALPETMLESELFGHARGAYTDAREERDGKLVAASGGTLLLDEIETISPRAQVQLLRVLDDGVVQPLGSDTPRTVNIRLLCSSNVDLEAEVRRHPGGFLSPHHGAEPPGAGPAGAHGGHPAAGGALHAPRRRPGGPARAGAPGGGAGGDDPSPVARQRAGAEERGGAHGHHGPVGDNRRLQP